MNAIGTTTGLPGLEPDLDRAPNSARTANLVPVRYRFIDDCETPVSAFLKLRGDGPAFLLESAEQGRLGRWSFLGFRPRSILRWSEASSRSRGGESVPESGSGATPDRVTEGPIPTGRWRIPRAVQDRRGRGAAAVRRRRRRALRVRPGADRRAARRGQPDPVGLPDMALMITDVLVAFDHQRHEVTLIANAFVEDGGIKEAYERAVEAIGEVRERLREPVPEVEPSAESTEIFESNMSREQFESTVSRVIEYVHAGDAFQVAPRSASPLPLRSRPSRSTAACARSIPRPTCTSSTSATSRSPAPRPSPWSR